MILKIFLLFFIGINTLYAQSKISTELEFGLLFPKINGSVSNLAESSNFREDFNYDTTTTSYFALDLGIEYDYIPNLFINYFYMQENADAVLNKNIRVADGDFNSSISSVVEYNVLNTVIYQDFKHKGEKISFLGRNFYSGDFEFDIGLNTKMLTWNFEVTDKTNLSKPSSWIKVREFIPLPYIGFRYYLYKFRFYSSVSALSFIEAKALDYQVGIAYRVIQGLYLSSAYMHEEFKVVEENDTIRFSHSGYKFSFMYAF